MNELRYLTSFDFGGFANVTKPRDMKLQFDFI